MSRALRRIGVLILTLVPAGFAVFVTVEAIRTGRFALGGDSAADSVPDSFYATDSFLPAGILDNAGWVIAACIVWIVVVALLAGLSALRRGNTRRTN
nr:hypothetical protein [Propionicimonas sp.]